MFAGHLDADDFLFECIAVSFCRFSNLGGGSVPAKKLVHGFRVMPVVGSDGNGCSKNCSGKVTQLGQKEEWSRVRLQDGRDAWFRNY